MSEKTFRFYQRDAIQSTQFSWCENKRTLGRLGTAGGKTAIAAGLAKEEVAMGGRVLFIGDSDELCLQPLRAMREFAGIIPSLDKSDRQASLEADIVVASSQTLCKKERLEYYPKNHFTKVIVDEAHRGLERDLVACDHFEDAQSLFLTATPYRKGVSNLKKWIPDVAFNIPLKKKKDEEGIDLMGMGFCPPVKILPISVMIDLEEVRPVSGDYRPEDLDTKIAPWYDEIADQIRKHGKGYKIIVFLPLIRSSIEFATILRAHGISARHVDGSSPDRKEIIAAFGDGDFQVITNSDVLSTGVDIPSADCLLDLSPTMSMARLEQRVGRICRVLPGTIDDLPEAHQSEERRARIAASKKPHALLMDVLCNAEKLARPYALMADSPEDARGMYEFAKKFRSPQEMEELAKKYQQDKEAKLIAEMEKAANKRGRSLISASWLGDLLKMDSAKSYFSTRAVDLVAASDAQINLLRNFGLDPESIQDKGHASFLIGMLAPRFKARMATPGQLVVLRKMHVPDGHNLTQKKAAEIIGQRSQQRSRLREML